MTFLWAFLVGGALCLAAQLVLEFSRLTPAHVLVLFVVLGALAAGAGIYEPLVKVAGEGANIPLPGFGYTLVDGVLKDLPKEGWAALFSGSFKASGSGIKAAIVFGLVASWIFRSRA